MNITRVPSWRLWLYPQIDAEYYGYRWCLHVGPWLVFFGAPLQP